MSTIMRPFVILIVGLLLASTSDAAAYIDPGSSSYLFQLLVAGLTAVVFFFSSIKRRIVRVIRLVLPAKPQSEDQPPIDTPTPRDI